MSTTLLENGMVECYFKELDIKFIVEDRNKALLIGIALGYYKEKLQKNFNKKREKFMKLWIFFVVLFFFTLLIMLNSVVDVQII